MTLKPIHFNREDKTFTKVLNKRVNDYFKTKGIDKKGNWTMVVKSVFMILLLIVPYSVILMDVLSIWGMYLMAVMMGTGIAGIGLSVMHDANHGAYSKYPIVNKIMGYTINIIGGNATNWQIQHNIHHHTYTNIEGHDEDISTTPLMRFNPHAKVKKMHKYQHWYAWFFYGLMTLSWSLVKDWKQLFGYAKDGYLKRQKVSSWRAWTWLATTLVFFFFYIIAIPAIVTSFLWWQMILAFVLMQYVSGMILSTIFQPAHVSPGLEFPVPDDESKIEDAWAVHQLRTTCNFANNSRFFSWYIGGLNFQIEHHLFPNICHIHYKGLSKIVKETAAEFNLPYHSQPTFVHALYYHGKLLKELGQAKAAA